MIGAFGKLPDVDQQNFMSSQPYYQDDYTWCVRRAKLLPLDLNVLQVCSLFAWIMVICHGLVQGVILNIFLQFDRKYVKRNHRDIIYAVLLISFPSVIGVSQRFQPKNIFLRIYYGLNLLCGVIMIAYIITYGYAILKKSIYAHQVNTIAEIVENEFRLTGMEAVLQRIRGQNAVS